MGTTLSIIEETSEYYPQPMYDRRLSNTSQTSYNADYSTLTNEINFKTIKLRFSINGEFEIK